MTLLPPFSEACPQMAQSRLCQAMARNSGLRFLPQEISGKAALDCQQCIQAFPIGDQGCGILWQAPATA